MINIYKIDLTNLQQKIMRLLFVKTGEELNARKIARILKVSQPAVSLAISGLSKLELIKAEQDKESKRWSIELNREKRRAMQEKRVDNIKQMYESGLADFIEKEYAGATIILFGSYSKGEDTLNSDIDIAVIGRKEKETDFSEFERALERKIHILCFDKFTDIHKNLRENIFNGITLTGTVEL